MGFVIFVFVVVAAVLVLLGGLRRLGVLEVREPPQFDGPRREDLLRLEDALAALDSRLDRLEDQQRFLEGLLEARPAAQALPPSMDAAAEPPDDAKEMDRGVESVLFDVEPKPK